MTEQLQRLKDENSQLALSLTEQVDPCRQTSHENTPCACFPGSGEGLKMPLPLVLLFETPSHRVSLAGLELSFCCLCLLGSGLKVCATTPTIPSPKKPSCLRLCHDLIQQLKDFLSILLAHEFSVCLYVYVHACACAPVHVFPAWY